MKIVFDNCIHGDCHAGLWGFSAYFEAYHLLFDTGSNGRVLLKNLQASGIDISEIRCLFITHDHWDHIGGIDSILELNQDITIFAPSTLSKNHIRDLRSLSKEVIVVGRKPRHLYADLYSTGMLGDKDPEHSLIIANESPRLITGCGHYGIASITEKAQEIIGREIREVVGGFHLLGEEKGSIVEQIDRLKSLGVTKALPTHCSGEAAIRLFAELIR